MTKQTRIVFFEDDHGATAVLDIKQSDDLLLLLRQAYRLLVLTDRASYAVLEVTERFGQVRQIRLDKGKQSQDVWIRDTLIHILQQFLLI